MKLIAGGRELQDKWSVAIHKFTENTDPDDPEYITPSRRLLCTAVQGTWFCGWQHSQVQPREQGTWWNHRTSCQVTGKQQPLAEKYNGDNPSLPTSTSAYVEENKRRFAEHKAAIFSYYDDNIVAILTDIKSEIAKRCTTETTYWKKDEYFEMTVMTEIAQALYNYPTIEPQMDDFSFIQTRIARQYINQYNATYPRS